MLRNESRQSVGRRRRRPAPYRFCLFSLALLGTQLLAGWAHADSLYTPTSNFNTLFSDRKAAHVGDVLEILITETAQATQSTDMSTSNSTNSAMGPGVGKLNFLPLLGYTGSATAASKGDTNRSGTFTARIEVVVTGITPAGNLQVEGSRNVTVLNDFQIIKLTGEVRPQDIDYDNTVPSYKVANALVSYTGSDPLRPNKKVGVITRVLHWLF
jgi:flagellar L-ring protein precursor FlgH